MELSHLAQNYPASVIRRITQHAQKFDNVLYFTMGEPNFNSPEIVKKTAIKGIEANNTDYGPNAGETSLRTTIADQYNQQYGTDFSVENVIISFGATEGILLTMLATLNQGDEVMIIGPHYPNYLGQIETLGLTANIVETQAENHFEIQVATLKAALTGKTRMLILNTPNNPLGTVISKDTSLEIAQFCADNNIVLLADEVYHTLVYDKNEHYSFAHPKQANFQNSYVVDSFSKSYSMTGYRVGYVITPNIAAINAMTEFKEGIGFAVPSFIQEAAEVALLQANDATENMLSAYSRRRSLLIDGLNEIAGISCDYTQGAFYAFADISGFNMSSEDFVYALLDAERCAVIPGSSFGTAGEGFVRISFAASDEDLTELLVRLKRFSTKQLG